MDFLGVNSMQLEGATKLERELYDVCRLHEQESGCGELQTRISVALSDASNELQRLRLRDEESTKLFVGMTAKAADARQLAELLSLKRDDAVQELHKLADLLSDQDTLRVCDTNGIARIEEIIGILGTAQ
jgi:hypothetical protein